MILNDPKEMAVRERIHKRIQAEIYHYDRERAFQAEEMLDTPPGWNEVKDLILEDGDILSENTRPEKRGRDEIAQGRRKRRNEDDIRTEKREHSIPRTGMKTNKKRMNGRHQTNSRRSLRWCFATESYRVIR